jgi:hypothetical protein
MIRRFMLAALAVLALAAPALAQRDPRFTRDPQEDPPTTAPPARMWLLRQELAPDGRGTLERVAAADPARWACAHSGRDCEADWIKAAACELHAIDPRFGLNGKRGNVNTLSLDVITWRLGPTDRHVQAFDVCGACGSREARVVWNDITNWDTLGGPNTAVWVQPYDCRAPAPPTPPTPPPGDGGQGPGTPAPSLGPVLAELAAIRATLADLEAVLGEVRSSSGAAAFEAFNAAARASEIKTTLEALPSTITWPEYQAAILGRPVIFRPRQ